MATLINRTLSLLVFATYLAAAIHYGVFPLFIKLGLPLLLALAFIWFPDELGEFTGLLHYHVVTAPTHGVLLRAVGWLILIGVPLVVFLIARGTPET